VGVLTFLAHIRATDKTGLAPKVTQQDLANRLGLSCQRTNVPISRLKESGLIDEDGSIKAAGRAARAAAKPYELSRVLGV